MASQPVVFKVQNPGTDGGSTGQKTLLYDASGNPISSTGGALNVRVSNFPAVQAVTLSSAMIQPVRTVTSNDTATLNDYLVLVDATSGALTEKLPASLTSVQTTVLVIKKKDSSVNTVTVDGNGALIDGVATFVLYTQNSSITLQWNGGGWSIEAFDPGNWATWTPTVTGSGAMTISGATALTAQWVRNLSSVSFMLYIQCTLGGTANNAVKVTYPIPCVAATNTAISAVGIPPGQNWQAMLTFLTPGTVMNFQIAGLANYALGAIDFTTSGTYRI